MHVETHDFASPPNMSYQKVISPKWLLLCVLFSASLETQNLTSLPTHSLCRVYLFCSDRQCKAGASPAATLVSPHSICQRSFAGNNYTAIGVCNIKCSTFAALRSSLVCGAYCY